MMRLTCDQCGKEFTVDGYMSVASPIYCSFDCRILAGFPTSTERMAYEFLSDVRNSQELAIRRREDSRAFRKNGDKRNAEVWVHDHVRKWLQDARSTLLRWNGISSDVFESAINMYEKERLNEFKNSLQ